QGQPSAQEISAAHIPATSGVSGSSSAFAPAQISSAAQISPAASASQHLSKRLGLLFAAVAILLVVGAGFWFLRSRNAHTAGSLQHKAVAVLYFNNLSQDQSLNWLDNGLTDMLTTNLAQVKGLDVLSTERVMGAVQRASKD